MNPYGPPTTRDTPEQVDQLHRAGYRRQVEIDGIGIWEHPHWPNDARTGAEAALTHAWRFYADELKPSRLERIRRR